MRPVVLGYSWMRITRDNSTRPDCVHLPVSPKPMLSPCFGLLAIGNLVLISIRRLVGRIAERWFGAIHFNEMNSDILLALIHVLILRGALARPANEVHPGMVDC